MTLLTVDNLTITSGGKTLVSNISLSIAPGERLGLIGESGSGKSLTAMAVTGLLPRALKPSGSIVLHDQQVIGAPESQLNRLRGSASAVIFRSRLPPSIR